MALFLLSQCKGRRKQSYQRREKELPVDLDHYPCSGIVLWKWGTWVRIYDFNQPWEAQGQEVDLELLGAGKCVYSPSSES